MHAKTHALSCLTHVCEKSPAPFVFVIMRRSVQQHGQFWSMGTMGGRKIRKSERVAKLLVFILLRATPRAAIPLVRVPSEIEPHPCIDHLIVRLEKIAANIGKDAWKFISRDARRAAKTDQKMGKDGEDRIDPSSGRTVHQRCHHNRQSPCFKKSFA